MNTKTVVVEHMGHAYRFEISTSPMVAQDEMWIENKKKNYLFDKISPDTREIERAILLASFELVVKAGIEPPQGTFKHILVGQLPSAVINAVMKEYRTQFESVGDLEEQKKS
jgi:hypothetical protein